MRSGRKQTVIGNVHSELLDEEFDALDDRDWQSLERAAHIADEVRDEDRGF